MSLLCIFTLFGFSQTQFKNTASNPTGGITDAGVDTCSYALSHSYPLLSIQTVVTKSAGTMAGTSILARSVDGINYVNVDTLTNTNVATNTRIYTVASAARYWRVITSGSTTVTAVVKAFISASN